MQHVPPLVAPSLKLKNIYFRIYFLEENNCIEKVQYEE